MAARYEKVLAAITSNDPIRADAVRRWMAADELTTRGAVYHLLQRAVGRIAPPLSQAEYYPFMLDYLFDCLLLNPKSNEFLHSGFEAAWDLVAWLKHVQNYEGSADFIAHVVSRITVAYVSADNTTRNRIETGLLEHILESPSLRKYLVSWKDDPDLGDAYKRCLEWGSAHEDEK
jgi:hypothetical protein